MNRFFSLLLGLALFGGAMYFSSDVLRLQRHGVAVEGMIVDARTVHEVTYSDRHGIDSNTKHTALIEFTPEGASKPVRITASFWTRQTIGNTVKVLYNPADTGDAIVAGWDNWLGPAILAVIGGYLLLYALGLASGEGINSDSNREWTLFRWFD
jgi:hypothetical protein